jgi:hypothetical protein
MNKGEIKMACAKETKTKKGFAKNIKIEEKKHPKKQAIAIAYGEADKAKKRDKKEDMKKKKK